MRAARTGSLALALWLAATTAAGALSPEPAQVRDRLAELASGRTHLSVRTAGTSAQGRPLPLLVATARPQAIGSQLRVLVLARQHGDEQVPAEAALLWLQQAAAQPALFRDLALFLMPTVNPDGAAAGTRANSQGVDLNRDWERRGQPETRAVERVFDRWQPHVVLDLHSFHTHRDEGAPSQSDWIETFRLGPREATPLDALSYELAADLVQRQRAAGERVQSVQTRTGEWATTLCHRHFAKDHAAVSLLCEVAEGRNDPEARVLGQLLERLADRAGQLKPRLDALRGLNRWQAPAFTPDTAAAPPAPAPPAPAEQAPKTPPLAPLSWYAAALGLMTVTRIKTPVFADERE